MRYDVTHDPRARLLLFTLIAALATACPQLPQEDPPDATSGEDAGERDAGPPEGDAEVDAAEPPPPPPEVGLEVVSVGPAPGTVGPDATFEVAFDRPVDRATLAASLVHDGCQAPLRLRDEASGRCHGARTEQAGPDTLRVVPAHPLGRGRTYTLEVVAGQALGVDGTTLAADVTSRYDVDPGGPARAHTISVDGADDFDEDERVPTSDAKGIAVTWDADRLYVGVSGEDMTPTNKVAYVVVGARDHGASRGASYVPAGRWFEGSTTLLPTHATHVFMIKSVDGQPRVYAREWSGVAWRERAEANDVAEVALGEEFTEIALDRAAWGAGVRELDVVVYLKNLASDCGGECDAGWGWTFGAADPSFEQGYGDRIVNQYLSLDLGGPDAPAARGLSRRFGADSTRHRIYQLLVRTFGNTNETRKPNGTLAENGVGRFEDLNDAAAAALADMGMTHVWLTGVPQQATSTDWSEVGEPADDPDILKGLAGSPYAVRDYFDVSPDYAADPAARVASFRAAVERLHAQDLRVIVDVVPNHVARSYRSTVRPDLTYGQGDDRGAFFAPDNHFFYLQDGQGPVNMPGFDRGSGAAASPTCQVLRERGDDAYQCDGLFDWRRQGELEHGRVTGNNVASWSPDLNSWYETVKINYGFDYTTGASAHPTDGSPDAAIPRSWRVMDEIIAHWQRLGVDGFRADMVHMVPMEFQRWLIARSRARNPEVFWMAEAYDTDPAKVTAGNVLHALLGAGYDAVYDDETYDGLKAVFDGTGWANDVDAFVERDAILRHHSLRYAENHDEVRLCSAWDWRFDGQNVGCAIGPAITALLHGLGRGPVMVFAGQETGEPAAGAEGFGGDDGRTTIFDYWSMPTFTGWVNGHAYDGGGLDDATKALRERHVAVWDAMSDPVFAEGEVVTLNGANVGHAPFGRTGDEAASGHHAYAFLRHVGGRAALVYVWLHPTATLPDASVLIPADAWAGAALPDEVALTPGLGAAPGADRITGEAAASQGVPLGEVAPGEVRIVWME